MVGPRWLALWGTALARALITYATLRVILIKIGTVIVSSATSMRVHLDSHHPRRQVFLHACGVLSPPRWASRALKGLPRYVGEKGPCRGSSR
jgi:hypothetical protein